ncbi:MAG: hypothetical protein ACE5D7_08460 [Fidelibacterota bacterium]
MSDTFDTVLKQLGKWGEVVADKSGFYFKKAVDKGGELTKIGKVQLEIEKLKRDINHKFTDLGRYIYHSVSDSGETDYSNDIEFQSLIDDIKAVKNDLDQKYQEKVEIRREGASEEKVEEKEQDVPIGI